MAKTETLADILAPIRPKVVKIDEDFFLDGDRKTEAISSGSLLLDSITGGGLLHKGRMSEIFGAESSGKSTFAIQSSINALKKGKMVLFFDFEQTYHRIYAKALGLDEKNPNFQVVQPYCIEDGAKFLKDLENKLPDDGKVVLIFDSVAAMKPKKLLEAAGEQPQIGLHALRVGALSSYLNSVWCGKKKAFVLFTNQIRRVPAAGGMFQAKAVKDAGIGFGVSSDTSFTTTGGHELRFMLSLRVMLDFAGKIEEGSWEAGDQKRTGNFIKAFTVKNKITSPYQTSKMAVLYGEGTSDEFAMLELLKDYEYITQGGAVYTFLDLAENEPGKGLSFKQKGKADFYAKLKEPKYKTEIEKIYKHIMENYEAVEHIGTGEDDYEESDFDEDEELE